LCLTGQQSGALDITGPENSIVHAMALRPPDAQYLLDTSTSVIWSPRSNISLYGATTPVTMYANMGIQKIALSTDWTVSGSMNILRELDCARNYNSRYLGGYFTDYQLWKMVTTNAAVALNLDDQIGVLAPEYFADITIFSSNGVKNYRGVKNYHSAVINARVEDVVLVLRGGIPLYGDTRVIHDLQDSSMQCQKIPGGVCRADNSVCLPMKSSFTLDQLVTANVDSLPLFYCGIPEGEPSCVPMRPADEWGCGAFPLADSSQDRDRDGVEDIYDNCPTIFNPVLPLDGWYAARPEACRQADYDNDRLGDACDPDPLNP
jgi:hypothetical protein